MSVPKQKPGRSKQDYATPAAFIRAVKKRLKITHFAIDFAADAVNTQAPLWMDAADGLADWTDALQQPNWARYLGSHDWGWLNPPYSHIEPWAMRCCQAAGQGAHIAFLVPASVGANWFRDYVFNCDLARVLFLNGRLAFMPDKPTWLYPKDCMLVLYDPNMRVGTKFAVWDWRKDA